MSPAWVRVDDRLLHGQVLVGCCAHVDARRVVLCSDAVAADDRLSRLYAEAAAASGELEVWILDRAQTVRRWAEEGGDIATVLVVEGLADALWLHCHGLGFERLNLGGMHPRDGARERWPGYHLTLSDLKDLHRLVERGVEVLVGELPRATTDVTAQLRGAENGEQAG